MSNPSASQNAKPAGASNPSRSTARSPKFNLTQLGNAERLVYEHGSSIRYCPAWKSWLIWDGRQWRVDTTGAIYRKAHRTVRQIARDARSVTDTGIRAALEKHARQSERRSEIDAMVDMARTLENMPVTPEQLDADPMLLNCRNGVVDLHSGKLLPHSDCKYALLTKITPVTYRPDARCPLWLRFLGEIFNHDSGLIDYVQRIIGYSLTGNVTEKALFLFYGDGNNGKTTLLETIRHMLGDYAGLVEIDALMLGSGDSARERAIADLHRKRFVTASEAEAGQKFREATIKKLTGMGRLVGRRLYSNSFEFDPEFKLFIDANHKPQIRGTDEAIWSRIRLVPFTVTIPKAKIDKNLWNRLRGELPGILAWAVEGCVRWQEKGLGSPDAVTTASASYREEMDVVKMFIADCCEEDPEGMEGATTLYGAFRWWCANNGEEEDVLAQNAFGQRLGKYGYESHRTGSGNCWKGIRLLRPPAPSDPKPAVDPWNVDLWKVTIEPGDFDDRPV